MGHLPGRVAEPHNQHVHMRVGVSGQRVLLSSGLPSRSGQIAVWMYLTGCVLLIGSLIAVSMTGLPGTTPAMARQGMSSLPTVQLWPSKMRPQPQTVGDTICH